MAEKRMFAKSIVNSDVFLDMPLSTQALYFHLCMEADDWGFVGNPKRVQRFIGATDDDMRILLAKRYLLSFDSGVIVIKHWFTNNFIRSDRIKETTYIEELNMLMLDEKKAYTEKDKKLNKIDNVSQLDNQMTTNGQPRLDKIRLDKSRVECTHACEEETETDTEETTLNEDRDNFSSDLDCLSGIPTLQEVKDFITLKSFPYDAEYFYNYYAAQGWKRHGHPIENWQALATQWGRNEAIRGGLQNLGRQQLNSKNPEIMTRSYSQQDYNQIFNTNDIKDDDI